MKLQLRGILLHALKISIFLLLFLVIQSQVIEIRHDIHGNANGVAEAQNRTTQELSETRHLIQTALEDSQIQFARARKVLEESTEMLQNERRELARIIDDRTVAMESTLKDRLEKQKDLLEGARSGVEANAALVQKLERALDQDVVLMKRKMVYSTVQLRGDGTVGSGILVYSEPQGDEKDGNAAVATFILTAHHVVMEVLGNNPEKRLVEEIRILAENDAFDPDPFKADLVLFDRDRDTALLKLRSRRRFNCVADFAPREMVRRIDVFTRAYAVGCPLGNRPLPTVGEISSKSKVVGDQVFWMLSAPTFFGNSGGGIYLASSFQLIGISSMIYTYGKTSPTVVPHMGLFVPLEAIYDWLDAEGHSFIYRREPIPKSLLGRYGLLKESPQRPGRQAAGMSEADRKDGKKSDSR